MNLVGHLECFVAVAEELHFGRAAVRLGMAQPPLSQRIQRLERELGTRLFDRSSRRVALTAPGRLLLDEARDLLARAERIQTVAERAGGLDVLRAGIPHDLGGPAVAALIAAFREVRPSSTVELRPASTTEQLRGLADGTLDVGTVRHPCDTRGLALGPLLGQALGVLLPAGSAPASEVHLSDLAGHELVVFPREEAPGAHDELLAACRRHGYDPPAVHGSAHPQFALGLVLAGTAVALLPRPAEQPGVVWRPLVGSPLTLRTSCAWRDGDDRDGVVTDFVRVATGVLRTEAAMIPVVPAAARRVVIRPASGFLT